MPAPYSVGDSVHLKPRMSKNTTVSSGHDAYKHASENGRSRYDIADEFDVTADDLQDGQSPDGDPPNYQFGQSQSDVIYTEADKGVVLTASHPDYRVRLYHAKLLNDDDA